jgi:DNA polymerase-3 subunit gamma/tau
MLATEIRARKLDDIVGQDTIVKGLKNYLKNDSVPDVIYFIGHSGSGKTTLAYLMGMAMNCHNPIKESDGSISPCNTCPSCLDVIHERFQRDIHVYNGGQLKAEGIEEIEEKLNYASMNDKNLIFILNEAQMITSIKKFLAMIEKPRKNVHFFLTSTDKDKFKNSISASNKDQETTALRSRGAFFNIKPIATNVIMDYLFMLLEKFDPEGKTPTVFLEEGLTTIAENSKGNIRMAINDFSQCINSEAYSLEEIRSLLGYDDEQEFLTILYSLAKMDTRIIPELMKQDISSFFYYSWTILNGIGMRILSDVPFHESWKEKTAKAIMQTNNYDKLLAVYEKTNSICLSYFNEKVFINQLYYFLKSVPGVTRTEVKKEKIKKAE